MIATHLERKDSEFVPVSVLLFILVVLEAFSDFWNDRFLHCLVDQLASYSYCCCCVYCCVSSSDLHHSHSILKHPSQGIKSEYTGFVRQFKQHYFGHFEFRNQKAD